MTSSDFENLSSKILIASPFAMAEGIFYHAVIYVLTHSKEGAAGLIINHLINKMPYKKLFKAASEINLSNEEDKLTLPVYLGGPVEVERGFFLHSSDYDKDLLFKFQNNLAVSSNSNILKDIAHGIGPKNSLFIIGYTNWKAGQLEQEIQNNLWLTDESDEELIFSNPVESKWHQALGNLGINNLSFVPEPGKC